MPVPQPSSQWRRATRAVVAATGVGLIASIALVPPMPAAAVPSGSLQGVTARVFDLGFNPGQLCKLRPGQTPNTDVLRSNIDYTTPDDFGGGGAVSPPSDNFFTQVITSLEVQTAGNYGFRLFSDDGSRLDIDGSEVILNDGLQDGLTPKQGSVALTVGQHDVLVEHFDGSLGQRLLLEWRPPGATGWAKVPDSLLSTPDPNDPERPFARVVAPGKKACVGDDDNPGNGLPLADVHPDYNLTNLRADGWQPKVTGMDWLPNGDMIITTWGESQTSNGEVWVLGGTKSASSPAGVTRRLVHSGLREPMGITVTNDGVYVSEKHQLSKLVDNNADGVYESKTQFATWQTSTNYHEFAFGLLHDADNFYLNLSVPIGNMGTTTAPQPVPNRGTSLEIDRDTGEVTPVAGGLRTPNGIGYGPDGIKLIADNQGDWLPASKFVQLQRGAFYNHYNKPAGPFDSAPVTKPVLWLPQNEIANSPTTPITLKTGPFAGDLVWGDVTYGGVQRATLEKVGGQWQGAAFRFTQGLESGVNRLLQAPNGDLIIGGIGGGGNWNQPGKLHYGLQRLSLNQQQNAFDFASMELNDTNTGFELSYTKPLSDATIAKLATAYQFQQYNYAPADLYGGAKQNEEWLDVTSATVSADKMTVDVRVAGLKPNRVVHVRTAGSFAAASGSELWNSEAWYTLNTLPGYDLSASGVYEAELATRGGSAAPATDHGNYTGSSLRAGDGFGISAGFVSGFERQGASVTFDVESGTTRQYDAILRYGNGPNPDGEQTKQVTVTVNDGPAQKIQLPTTRAWNKWADFALPLSLTAGANRVKISYEAGDNGWVNFDHLRVFDRACAPAQPDPGFTTILDGTQASAEDWTMVGPGELITLPDCSRLTVGGLGLLHYNEMQEDFELRADWKMNDDDDNSGIFLGFDNPNGNALPGDSIEVQIDPTDTPDATTGAIYKKKAANAAAVKSAIKQNGRWNSYTIRKVGQRVAVWLNGTLINDYTSPAGDVDLSSGLIGLQNHHTGGDVYYRNVQLKALASTDPVLPPKVVQYEAEDGARGGSASTANNHAGFTGTGFVGGFESQGASVTLTVDGPAASTYDAVLRYANGPNPDGEQTKQVSVSINGGPVQKIGLPTTKAWGTWGEFSLPLALTQGANTVKISYEQGDQGWVNIDHLRVLVPQAVEPEPEPEPELFDTFEAETAVRGGSAAIASNHAGFSGTGFVAGFENQGASVDFAVDKATAGTYRTVVRYANGPNPAGEQTKQVTLTVNGQAQKIALPTTRAWGTWAVLEVPLVLAAGANSVKISYEQGDDGWVNLDNLRVRKAREPVVDPEPEAAATRTEATVGGVSVYGTAPEVRVTVSRADGVTVDGGTVEVRNGSTVVGRAVLGSDGMIAVRLDRLPVGRHTLTVAYGGVEEETLPSSTTVNHSVTRTPSSTSVSSEGRKLTVRVASQTGVPVNGWVRLVVRNKAKDVLLRRTVAVRNGVATATFRGLRHGRYTVKANYRGSTTVVSSQAQKVWRIKR